MKRCVAPLASRDFTAARDVQSSAWPLTLKPSAGTWAGPHSVWPDKE